MKLVNELLAQGLPHDAIRKVVSPQDVSPEKLEKYLSNIADAPLVKTHRLGILGFQLYLLALNTLAVGSLAWLGYSQGQPFFFGLAGVGVLIAFACWYGISRNMASAYVGVCCLTATGSMQLLKAMKEDPTTVGICLFLNLLLIAYAVSMKFMLFPQQNFFNTKKPVLVKA